MRFDAIVVDIKATLGDTFVAEEVRERTFKRGGKDVVDDRNVIIVINCLDRRARANMVVPKDGNHVGPVGKYNMPVRLTMPTVTPYDFTDEAGARRIGAAFKAVAVDPLTPTAQE